MEITCETCGASLSTSKSLQRHVPAQHQDLKHLCQFCYKAFKCNKKVKKKKYQDVHTQHLGMTYTCEKCKKSFKYSWDRKTHSQTCGT